MLKTIKLKMYICVCLLLGVLASVLFGGCFGKNAFSVYDAEGGLVFDGKHTEITVEYGETYLLPMQVQVGGKKTELASMGLYDASGNALKLAYGSYTFKQIGDYTVKYSTAEHSAEYKILCRDTVAPEIKIVGVTTNGSVGDLIRLPVFSYSDAAGVEKSNVSVEILSPLGVAVMPQGDYLLLETAGTYTVTLVVKDNNGLETRETISIEALPIYVDEDREEAVLYSFDKPEYIGLVTSFNGDSTISREIVTEGYPALDSEGADNGVLKISSTKSFGDVYTRFMYHEEVFANTGYRIKIRFAVTTDTDYVKVFRNYKNLSNSEIVGQYFGAKANTWYELEINPLEFGYHAEVKDFAVLFRDSGDTVLYIDEIYFTPIAFVDAQLAENTIADFDEDGYMYNVYDNLFIDPTTGGGKRVPGSEFSLVTANEAPAANGASTKAPGLGMDGKALMIRSTDKWMGMNFMFPEKINVKDVIRLSIRTYLPIRSVAIVVGFFNESGYDMKSRFWCESLPRGEWFDWTFPGEALTSFTNTGEISGFFMQFKLAENQSEAIAYIDQMYYVPKNETSEQSGLQIATFESEKSLCNVSQNTSKGTSNIGWEEAAFGKEGLLKVQSNVSADGFTYYFDEPVTITEGCFNISAYLPTGNTVRQLSVYAVISSALNRSSILICKFDAKLFKANKFFTLQVVAEDVLNAVSSGKLLGLMLQIETLSVSANNILYIDEIRLEDISTDEDAPEIVGLSVAKINALSGQEIDLSQLPFRIVDATDPRPEWKLIRITDATGKTLAEENDLREYTFTPTKSGTYTLFVKPVDWAGNEGAVYETEVEITVYEDKAEQYVSSLCFEATTDTWLVQTSLKTATIVKDGDKTVLAGSFGAKGIGGYSYALTIDLGGAYKASEIKKVVITYRIPEIVGLAGSTNFCIAANLTSANSPKIVTSNYINSTGSVSVKAMAEYGTLSVTGADLAKAIGDDTVVNSIAIWNTTKNSESWPVDIYIDNIVVKETVEIDYASALQFNDADSADLAIYSYSNADYAVPTIVTDGDKTVLAGSFSTCSVLGSKVALTIDVGGKYTASQISKITVTYKCVATSYTAGGFDFYVGANNTLESGRTEILKTSISGTHSEYQTLEIDGASFVSALGGDTVLNNIAFYNGTKDGGKAQYRTVYIDSIVITLGA